MSSPWSSAGGESSPWSSAGGVSSPWSSAGGESSPWSSAGGESSPWSSAGGESSPGSITGGGWTLWGGSFTGGGWTPGVGSITGGGWTPGGGPITGGGSIGRGLMTGGWPTGVGSMPSSTWGGGIQRSRASLPPSAGPNGSSVVCAAASWPEASSLGTGNSPICARKAAATSRAPDGSCPLIARLALAVKTVTTMAAPSLVPTRLPLEAALRTAVPWVVGRFERSRVVTTEMASFALSCSSGVAAARTASRSSPKLNPSPSSPNGFPSNLIDPSLVQPGRRRARRHDLPDPSNASAPRPP